MCIIKEDGRNKRQATSSSLMNHFDFVRDRTLDSYEAMRKRDRSFFFFFFYKCMFIYIYSLQIQTVQTS